MCVYLYFIVLVLVWINVFIIYGFVMVFEVFLFVDRFIYYLFKAMEILGKKVVFLFWVRCLVFLFMR